MTNLNNLDGIETLHGLTGTQQGILYQCLLSENSATYQNQLRFDIDGDFDSGVFTKSINHVISRHQALRSLFLYEGLDLPAVVVKQSVSLTPECINLSNESETNQQVELLTIARNKSQTPLKLNEAPLLRLTCVQLSNNRFHLILDFHHIVFDGWSNVLFFDEIKSAYAAYDRGASPDLPLATQFSDHVARLTTHETPVAIEFWRNHLNELDAPTPLPLGKSSTKKAYATSSIELHLTEQESSLFRDTARANRITLNSLIAAAWALVASRYVDESNALIGITVNGRGLNIDGHERTVGLFVNTLPLMVDCQPDLDLSKWLRQVQKSLSEMSRFENIPLSAIHKHSQFQPGTELFETLLVFQSFPTLSENTDQIAQSKLPWVFSNTTVHENSPVPLTIEVFDDKAIAFLAMFNDDRLDNRSVTQLLNHLRALLNNIAQPTNQNSLLGDITFLNNDDIQAETADYKKNDLNEFVAPSLTVGFETQAQLTPNRKAVSDRHTSLTYQALANLSDLVAVNLRTHAVNSTSNVVVYIKRDLNIYPTLLGILKINAKFVPMDANWPSHRVLALAKDCKATLIIVDEETIQSTSLDGIATCLLSDLMSVNLPKHTEQIGVSIHNEQDTLLSDDDAYIMYTSGSTGKPKGVIGKHSSTMNRLNWMWRTYPFTDTDVCVQKTALSFVDSIGELFGPLLKGVHTHVLSDDIATDATALLECLKNLNATRIVLVPSLLSLLLEEFDDISDRLASLRLCMVSGEPLPVAVAKDFVDQLPSCTLLNLYGSTEVAADACCAQINNTTHYVASSVGLPISQCSIHVLSQKLAPMPPGAIGEVFVGGICVANGYMNQPALTSKSFVANPFSDGKLFKTGDLGSRARDGSLVLHGRADSQQKVNGKRFDPQEVNDSVTVFKSVSQAITLIVKKNRICCWYLTNNAQPIENEALLEHLHKHLPAWMVPSQIIHMARFPLLSSGKIDHQALIKQVSFNSASSPEKLMPRTTIERKIAEIWQSILPDSEPTLHSVFAESGGDSLSAMKFNARVHQALGRGIAPRLLLVANLKQLANSLEADTTPAASSEVLHSVIVHSDTSASNALKPVAAPTRVEPFIFSADTHHLYGVVHRPQNDNQQSAVLLCSSIGHEYMKLHRLYNNLAQMLSEAGYFVLRFDYAGFGNSTGEASTVSVATWTSNIQHASDTLLEISKKQSVSLVGTRLGAPLMMEATVKASQRIIAVDPVYCGKAYVNHLENLHQYALRDRDRYKERQNNSEKWERFGYTYTESLLNQIAALRCDLNNLSSYLDVSVIHTGPQENDGAQTQGIAKKEIDPNVRQYTNLKEKSIWSNYSDAQSLIVDYSLAQELASIIEGKGCTR